MEDQIPNGVVHTLAPPPVVIKIGGALVKDSRALHVLWMGIEKIQKDHPVVVVHGGGPQATAMARRLGHEPRIVQGRRVTTDIDLDIMRWILRGEINTDLVRAAFRQGVEAVGLCGADGGMVRVSRRPPWDIDGKKVDFGRVGDVVFVDTLLLRVVLGGGIVPVIAPLGIDGVGDLFNVNADTVAFEVAKSLKARQLLLVTEAGGVRSNPEDPESVLSMCDRDIFDHGIAHGWIQGGMRVKLQVAFDALEQGIDEAYILAAGDLLKRERATRVLL